MPFKIPHLISGGIITNYSCSSRCRHCLYACSPQREKRYIDEETLTTVCSVLLRNGCTSIHIGGGEPFLQFAQLIEAIDSIQEYGIDIEYIETNASWFSPEKIEYLQQLKKHGIRTLLVSISPFHNEFVAFDKTKALIASCQQLGISVYPWVADFFSDLNVFDNSCTHSLEEYEIHFGKQYIAKIPQRYWIHYGGRAVGLFKKIYPLRPLDEILKTGPCKQLTNTSHFHFDLYGNYIPGLCSGLSITSTDIGKTFDDSNYPILHTLYTNGISGLFHIATEKGFVPNQYYLNQCDLCLHIRTYLVKEITMHTHELQPVVFYENL